MYYAFGNHSCTFSSVPLLYSLFGRHILFFLIYTNKILTLYTHVHLYTFSLGIYICSFTSVITYVFLDWKMYWKELHSVCMYVYMCTYIHSCSSAYIYPSMHTNVYVCLHPSIHTYIQMHVCICMYGCTVTERKLMMKLSFNFYLAILIWEDVCTVYTLYN